VSVTSQPLPSGTVALAERERRRVADRHIRTLGVGVALGSTGLITATTTAPIAANSLTGDLGLSGIAAAMSVVGAAAGAAVISTLIARRGPRLGLAAGQVLSLAGAVLGTTSFVAGSFVGLLVGLALVGVANASNQLARYAAADVVGIDRRASAIGVIVWAATIGAVAGPNLIGPADEAGQLLGLPPYAGGLLAPLVFGGLAAALLLWRLRPDPHAIADPSSIAARTAGTGRLAELVARPQIAVAIVSLAIAQAVMVLVMTMTPLYMTQQGHGLAAVGFTISAHTFGMFALSPIAGRLADRYDPARVVVVGALVEAAAATLAAIAPPDGGALLVLALFLLGWGWNLAFVAGSAMLTAGLSLAERTRTGGLADTFIWSSSAIASLGSGVILRSAGFTALGLLGAIAVLVPIALVLVRRSNLRVATTSA